MPNGTWIVGEMADAPRADGFKWGMTALPAVKAGGDSYSYTWFEQAWIPSGAEHQDAAKLFISYLYSDKACEIFAKAGAIQPVLGIADKLEGDMSCFILSMIMEQRQPWAILHHLKQFRVLKYVLYSLTL